MEQVEVGFKEAGEGRFEVGFRQLFYFLPEKLAELLPVGASVRSQFLVVNLYQFLEVIVIQVYLTLPFLVIQYPQITLTNTTIKC